MRRLSFLLLLTFVTLSSCQKQTLDSIDENLELMAKEKLNSLIDTAGRGDIIPIEESPLKRFLPKRESISESIQKLNSTSTPSTLFDLRNVPINLIVCTSSN